MAEFQTKAPTNTDFCHSTRSLICEETFQCNWCFVFPDLYRWWVWIMLCIWSVLMHLIQDQHNKIPIVIRNLTLYYAWEYFASNTPTSIKVRAHHFFNEARFIVNACRSCGVHAKHGVPWPVLIWQTVTFNSSRYVYLGIIDYMFNEYVSIKMLNKQRVLMQGIKGEMSGTVCVTKIFIYIWVVYSFCLFCCLFIIVTWWYMWCIVWQVASKRKYRHVW